MRFINDILDFIIKDVDYTITVNRVVVDSGHSKLYTCDTAHLRTGKAIILGGVEYIISNFLINQWIEVVGTVDLTLKSFVAYKFGFQSGTLKDSEMERAMQRKLLKQPVPFVWNQEPYNINQKWDVESPIFAEPNLTWYLIDECDTKNWLVKDHHREVIEPISNFFNNRVREFIKKRVDYFQNITDVQITPREYLGVRGENGNTARLFNERLSGIEVNFTLTITKGECCK